jgi:hypothetical protein
MQAAVQAALLQKRHQQPRLPCGRLQQLQATQSYVHSRLLLLLFWLLLFAICGICCGSRRQ